MFGDEYAVGPVRHSREIGLGLPAGMSRTMVQDDWDFDVRGIAGIEVPEALHEVLAAISRAHQAGDLPGRQVNGRQEADRPEPDMSVLALPGVWRDIPQGCFQRQSRAVNLLPLLASWLVAGMGSSAGTGAISNPARFANGSLATSLYLVAIREWFQT